MARMKGKRLTILSPKHFHLRLSWDQAGHVVDGMVYNRINIPKDPVTIDRYDAETMDIVEQLEMQGADFPDLVIGEDKREEELEKLKDLISRLEQDFVLMRNAAKTQTQENFVHNAYGRLKEIKALLFGSE